MKNKIYRALTAILITTAMMAQPLAVSAQDNAQNESQEEADSASLLEQTDIFAQQTATDEALEQEMQNGYSLEEALIVVNPYGTSPLSAVAVFHTDEALGGTVTVKGKAAENDITGTFEAATDHAVPIYGLYNGDTTEVEISLEDGTSATFEVATEDIKVDYGTITAEMKKESSYDYSKLTFICSTMGSLYAVDAAGDIRFYTNMGGTLGVHQLSNGHLLMPASYVLKPSYYKEAMIETDLLGKVYRKYMIPGGEHHDFAELSNGNLLVASDSPDLSSVEDYVVEIDRETGEVVWELDMKELIGIEDGQSASMDTDGSEESDWFHNNGLCYDEENDLILLSARHKDAIVAVNKTDKTLAWILGDPTGWEEVDESYFFTPQGEDFEWFYAQHNVSLLDNGDIVLFDNGTAKVKRVDGENRVSGDDVYSRAVVYHIDTEEKTVSQVTEYGKERGADWYADWISGVVSLDGTQDHLWITAGTHLHNEEENRSDYYPKDMFVPGLIKTTHIDQVDNGELSFELTISGDTYQALTYRSFRMGAYESGEYDITAVPEILGSLGETPYEELSLDVTKAETAATGWEVVQDGKKISVEGLYTTEKDASELADGYLVLDGASGQRSYKLTQSGVSRDDGTNVTAKGWVSTDGLDGEEWNIYLDVDGTIYNTGWKYCEQ